ncbi:MAG: TonB-dependent receptor [Phycisphaerae bacterium]|nr:TonB-dependent receptor [Gemmatimonadaceae bacterium]
MPIRGNVTSAGDGAAIFSAEVRGTDGQVLGRSAQDGSFKVRAADGDSVVIRALGFRERRVTIAPGLHVALQPLPTVLQTMNTTVGQREIRANEATAHVTVLDRGAIDAAAAISANQLLRQIPGLQEMPSPPSQTSIAIRGLDASRVLVLIDGEPAAGGLIENRDIGRLSTVAAERIEVTKGPSSVEFGSDALGGVINLVTAAPSKPFSADGVFRQGALGRRESTVGVSQTLGALGYRLSGGWRQVDRVTGIDDATSTLERVYDLRTSFRYRMSDRISFRADVQGSRERQRWPVGGGYNGFIDNATGQGFVEAQAAMLGGSVRGRAFAQRYNYQYRQSQLSAPIAGSGDSLEQRERLNRYLVAYSRSAGRQTIDVGVQFSTRSLVSPGKVQGDSAQDDVREFFARDSWIFGSILANAGVRYTSSSLWGDAINPSFGVAWQTSAALRLRSNVARGFRAPSFKDIRYSFANPIAGYAIAGNANLVPESSWSTSLGATWAPSALWSVDVEAFRNNVSDLIDSRYQGLNAAGLQLFQNVNVARAHTSGIETTVEYSDGPLTAGFGYNFLRARNDETGQPLSRRSTNTARMHVGRFWKIKSGVNSDISARYTGAAPMIGTVNDRPTIVAEQGGFLSIDGQMRANITPRAELSGGVNNLLDQRPQLYTPAFARQIYVALRLSWSAAD